MKLTISKAIGQALHEEMVRDPNVILMGEDVGVMGNVFAISRGFLDEFGANRVIDTPISESGFTGMAVGAAMRGLRPVVEWMYDDFITVCLDPVMNQAAKLRYMTGGQVKIPVVFRAPMGAGRRNAGQHSQCLEALFTHIPGLKVVCPSTAADAKGLLKAAIRDDDPVVFLEHKLLYAKKEELPDGEYIIPLGKADVKRYGKDVTIIAYSKTVLTALDAAKKLEAEGIDAEVVDLRSLVPLDFDTIAESVKKTGRVIITHESCERNGYGAEVAAEIAEKLFDELDAPILRVCGANIPVPNATLPEIESAPTVEKLVSAAEKLCKGGI